MASEDLIILTAAVSIESVVGITLNLHILIVYIGNLRNGVSLGSSDKVHLTKALLNVSLHVIATAQSIIFAFWHNLHFINKEFPWIVMVNMFLLFYSYWLTALLCVFYCTNITTCAHHIFVFLKRSLSSYLIHLILLSGLGSLAVSFLSFCFCGMEPAGSSKNQSTDIWPSSLHNAECRTISSILGCSLPFAIALVSTTFTLWSLVSHMWRMKQSQRNFTQSRFQTQINATRTMFLFLLIFVIYSVTQTFLVSMPPAASDVLAILSWSVMVSYPIAEAAIIIQSSYKLRNGLYLRSFFIWIQREREAET